MAELIDIPSVVGAPAGPPPEAPNWPEAVRFLEQAVKAGRNDPPTLHLLALAYKHCQRYGEARQTLLKIADPDVSVLLQRGILSHAERDYARAADEFHQAWEKAPTFYPAGYNRLVSLLYQGNSQAALPDLDRLATIAPNSDEQRFLGILRALLSEQDRPLTGTEPNYLLTALKPEEEKRLTRTLAGLPSFELRYSLFARLLAARPRSELIFQAHLRTALAQAKKIADTGRWSEAFALASPLVARLEENLGAHDPMLLISACNFLGICSCLAQEFDRALPFFQQAKVHFQRDFAQKSASNPRRHVTTQGMPMAAQIEQNLALTFEYSNRMDQAEVHWTRFLDFLEQAFPNSLPKDYLRDLAFEACSRLSDVFAKKEDWGRAANFLHRAHRIRPNDMDTLERLFQFYTHLRRYDDARKVLRRLREVRPHDPQAELFELEVREVRRVHEAEDIVNDLRRIVQRSQNEPALLDRAGKLVANLLPNLEKFADAYANQMGKVVDQMRTLPTYQINWSTVHDLMEELEEKYVVLRKVASKAAAFARTDDVRRELQRLVQHCDRKIDQSRRIAD